jgi:hypothetical protein
MIRSNKDDSWLIRYLVKIEAGKNTDVNRIAKATKSILKPETRQNLLSQERKNREKQIAETAKSNSKLLQSI